MYFNSLRWSPPHFFLRLTGDEAAAFPLNTAVAAPRERDGVSDEMHTVAECKCQWVCGVSRIHDIPLGVFLPLSCAPIPRARASAMIVARGNGIKRYGNPPPPITRTHARALTPARILLSKLLVEGAVRRFLVLKCRQAHICAVIKHYTAKRNMFEKVRGIFPRTL